MKKDDSAEASDLRTCVSGREHELKCWPEFFGAVNVGIKTFELRLNDRGYRVGDVLWLREWEPRGHFYTGRECRRLVTYVLDLEEWDAPGKVCMSIVPHTQERSHTAVRNETESSGSGSEKNA